MVGLTKDDEEVLGGKCEVVLRLVDEETVVELEVRVLEEDVVYSTEDDGTLLVDNVLAEVLFVVVVWISG